MVHQVSLHLKLDTTTYAWMQQMAFRTGQPRNRLINIACAKYVRLEQSKQRAIDAGKFKEWMEAAKFLDIY